MGHQPPWRAHQRKPGNGDRSSGLDSCAHMRPCYPIQFCRVCAVARQRQTKTTTTSRDLLNAKLPDGTRTSKKQDKTRGPPHTRVWDRRTQYLFLPACLYGYLRDVVETLLLTKHSLSRTTSPGNVRACVVAVVVVVVVVVGSVSKNIICFWK